MVWCEISELPYLRLRLSNTLHDVVVIGYDNDRHIVLMVGNDWEGFQEVSSEAFRRAHDSSSFPGRGGLCFPGPGWCCPGLGSCPSSHTKTDSLPELHPGRSLYPPQGPLEHRDGTGMQLITDGFRCLAGAGTGVGSLKEDAKLVAC